MKSNVCILNGNPGEMEAILNEVEKCARYNELSDINTLHVRLLAEELISMLPMLLDHCDGKFWMENDGNKYELHAAIATRSSMTEREKLLSIATSGKNEAAHGIMGKIRVAIDAMFEEKPLIGDFYVHGCVDGSISQAWSLYNYMTYVKAEEESARKAEEWDELERSIVAKIADDVLVSIKGGKVDIILKKEF